MLAGSPVCQPGGKGEYVLVSARSAGALRDESVTGTATGNGMPGEPATIPAELTTAPGPSSANPLASVYALVADDFAAVNALIPGQLTSDVAMVEEISQYIVESGGKRLRPMLTLAAAHDGGLGKAGDADLKLAAAVEFIHTTTLLHDDVIDESKRRHKHPTANLL